MGGGNLNPPLQGLLCVFFLETQFYGWGALAWGGRLGKVAKWVVYGSHLGGSEGMCPPENFRCSKLESGDF